MKIDFFNPGMEETLSKLVRSVYDQFVAPDYTEQGNAVFYDFIKAGNIAKRYRDGHIILTAIDKGKALGMLELKNNNHICLFFVDAKYHNQGIGTALFKRTLAQIKGKSSFIEVNSSPYAVKIYEALGFRGSSEIQEKDGIRYLPMRLELD